jgi:hypothetical protein
MKFKPGDSMVEEVEEEEGSAVEVVRVAFTVVAVEAAVLVGAAFGELGEEALEEEASVQQAAVPEEALNPQMHRGLEPAGPKDSWGARARGRGEGNMLKVRGEAPLLKVPAAAHMPRVRVETAPRRVRMETLTIKAEVPQPT